MTAATDTLQDLRDAWEAVARYSVIRCASNGTETALARGLTLREARTHQEKETRAIESAPGYRAVMSRPIVSIVLENRAEAAAKSAQPPVPEDVKPVAMIRRPLASEFPHGRESMITPGAHARAAVPQRNQQEQ